MSRTFPVLAIASLGALITSLVAGFLLASWVFTGIVPAHAAPPVIAAVLSGYGTTGALWLIFAAALLSLVSMILLARLARNIR